MVEIAKAFAGNLTEVDEADYNTGAVDASEFQNVEGDKPGAEMLLALSKGGTLCRYYLITGPADGMTNA